MRNLKSNVSYYLIASLLQIVAPIITFPYIARVIGPEGLGKINFIDYTAQIILLFTAFGIPIYGVKEIAKNRTNKSQLKTLVSELLLIHLFFSIIGLLIFIGITSLNDELFKEKNLIILSSLNILISSFALEWFIQGFEEFRFVAKRSFFIKILSVAFIFLLVKAPEDYIIYYAILIISNIALIAADLIFTLKKSPILTLDVKPIKHLKHLFLYFLTSAAISLYTYFDSVILGIVSGSLAVGFYTTGLKIIRLSQHFIDSVGNVLFPRISFLHASKNYIEINRIINVSVQYVFTISIPICFLFYLLAPEIVKLLAGEQFIPTVSVLRILSVLPLLIGLSNIFGIQILLPFNKEYKMLMVVTIGSFLSILLNLWLCYYYKELGAAIACIVTELIITLLMLYWAKKEVIFKADVIKISTIVLTSLLFLPVVFSCRYIFESNHVVLIFSILICLPIYFLIQLFIFKNPVLVTILQFIIKSFNLERN
ncbi:MAG: flippase [Flavisolibacter sp.]|nr:flippase [Flavisolibacter sp.]